jgi:phosphohistidine swiveling domain-containing protein
VSRRGGGLRPPLACGPGEGGPAITARLGGKARSLAVLSSLGEPVPPWFVVTALGLEVTLDAAGLRGRIDSRLARWGERAAAERQAAAHEVQGWVRALPMPEALVTAIDRARAEWLAGDEPMAVRSSAADEDGRCSSMAGVHATLLGVVGRAALLAAVREVWASAFGIAALGYREARQLPLAGIAVAVVVQRLVTARTSGVAFTADPVTGDTGRLVVNALYGMGEGLVGLGLEADRFVVDKQTGEISAEIADKRERLEAASAAEGGLRRVPVAEALRRVPSLATEQVRSLAHAALRAERRFGRPQDLEFAVDDDGRLWLLQSRAVTTAGEYGPAAGERIVWDHENWGENYPGVTLPMTYSVNRRLDRIGYRAFAEMMRIDPRRIVEHEAVFDTFLGYIRGRFFTNRTNRHRLFALLPGFAFLPQPLLKLFAVRPDELDPEVRIEAAPLRRWLVELPALLRLLGSLAFEFLRVDRQVARLLARADAVHDHCAALELEALSPAELLRVYDQVEVRLVRQWRIPMLNALFLRLCFVLLKSLCARWCGDATLSNELLRSEQVSATGRPVEDLLDLAGWLDRRPELRDAFLAEPPEMLPRRLARDPRFAGFAAEVERYLELYPYQGVVEMKLEEPVWRDQPERLYRVLRGYLLHEDRARLDRQVRSERARRAREAAERRAFAGLRTHGGPFPRSLAFRRLLSRVRELDRHREEVKRMRLRLLGLFRELLTALGERLAEEGILEQARDIFFLGFEEVEDYVRGQALTTDLRGLVNLRRRELERAAAERLDDRFETFGLVYHRNRFQGRSALPANDASLRGTGCSQGRITGAVRLLATPDPLALAAGEILVVERAHTGWIPLFPAISGLLIERGEVLSHCATVAREMGIPAIVGIPGLTATLRAGQRIAMDGAAGTVTILSSAHSESPQPTGKEASR